MRKMKITVTAEFEIPTNVSIHGEAFECEGVIFIPEINFDCIEVDPNSPEEPLRFPNDLISIKEYDIKNTNMESKVEYIED